METYQFQITDILSDDTPVNINKPRDKSFVITIYGIDEDSNRIVCHVRNYYPYFYLKVPNDPIDWSSSKCKRFLKDISSNNNSGVQGCKMPTKDNPFMNPTFMDLSSGNMEQSCSSYNNSVIRELERVASISDETLVEQIYQLVDIVDVYFNYI